MVKSHQYGSVHKQFPRPEFCYTRQILQLTEVDLEVLSIGPLDYWKKIYEAIQNTKA